MNIFSNSTARNAVCAAFALGMVAAASAQQKQYTLMVSEGTSGGQDVTRVVARFEPLAEALSKSIDAKINIVVVREFDKLEADMKAGHADLVMARPSDIPARGVRDYGYRLVATSKPDGQCVFLGNKGGKPLAKLNEISGRKIAMPEPMAYMSKLCQAEMRAAGLKIDGEQIKFHREQDVIAFSVENGFAAVGGVASYSGAGKNFEKDKRGVFLFKGGLQPYMPLVASKSISDAQLAKMRDTLSAINANKESPVLKSFSITGFDAGGNPERLLSLLKFLETK